MPDIQFSTVKDAVRWSEEMATIPGVKSAIGDPVSSGLSGGKLTHQEALDIALTVSALTAACRPWKGLTAKAVWGCRDKSRDQVLGIAIASRLSQTHWGKRKEHIQLVSLGIVTVKASRALRLYGDRFHVKRMAHDIGISRNQFATSIGWVALRHDSVEQINGWLEQAENEIGQELAARGWMS